MVDLQKSADANSSTSDDDHFMRADDGKDEDRMGFIRKVYSILSVQLSLTAASIAVVKLDENLNLAIQQPLYSGIAIGLLIISIIIQIAIFYCRKVSNKVPLNYILLFIFTGCYCFVFAFICSFYDANICLQAGGLTALVTIALTVYAFTTKTDFTVCGGLFFIMFVVLISLIIVSFFMTFGAWWHPFISALLIIFYGMYLIYDTQLIAGKGKHKLTYDDYIIGALLLYIDIMMLFLEILKVLGRR